MIFTVFKKELKDTLRDRRTLIMMLVIPILIFPIILNLFVSISHSFEEEAANKKVKIGMIGEPKNFIAEELEAIPQTFGEKEIIYFKDSTMLFDAILKDSIQFGLEVPSERTTTTPINVFYNAAELGMQDRAEVYLKVVEGTLRKQKLNTLNIQEAEITPLELNYHNVASEKEVVGKLAGGVLPYIFIAFGFLGCMYPAIDLFTGEKERGTMETLLTTPVPRWQLLFGKMGVVVLSGLLAATCSLLGLVLSIEVLDIVEDPKLLEIIHSILSAEFIVLLYALLLPLVVFFAGVMIPIAVYAKTFKEAQSIITPLNIVFVLPAMVGFFPGIELNSVTACIPVVNVVLATKELIAGTLDVGLLALSFGVMSLLAIIGVVISYKQFDKETNIIS